MVFYVHVTAPHSLIENVTLPFETQDQVDFLIHLFTTIIKIIFFRKALLKKSRSCIDLAHFHTCDSTRDMWAACVTCSRFLRPQRIMKVTSHGLDILASLVT